MADPSHSPTHTFAAALGWLEDAPLFIDTHLVASLFDFIVKPEWNAEQKTISDLTHTKQESRINGGAEGTASLPRYLSWATNLNATLQLFFERTDHAEQGRSNSITARAWDKSDRRMLCLTKTYFDDYPDRLVYMNTESGDFTALDGSKQNPDELISRHPRAIVFMDVAPNTPIVPTMIELETGGFRLVLKAIEDKILRELNPCPRYSDLPSERQAYWKTVREHFKSRDAMELVEQACHDARIGWIDFRLPFDGNNESAHLHIVPRGLYHTGVFAYHFIHRSFKYGCRMVGTLKAGRCLNVLAVYEK